MSNPKLHQLLQKKLGSFSGEHLPTAITYVDRFGNTVEKPLLDATLDEVAFSIQTIGSEIAAIHRRRSSLESLYNLSRENGCLGLNTIGEIAGEVTK